MCEDEKQELCHQLGECWAEVVDTFVYLLNRLPTKSLKNKTPYEAWYDVKPSINHLKIFGSICYYHVPKPKRSKLDSKAQKGILIGYGTSTKGYRILCLQTTKVVLSRNVKVDEMTTWDWQNKKDAHLMLASIIMKIFKLLNL